MAALEMVMVQDGTAHNGQIRIGPQEVVRELFHKAEQPLKGAPGNLHGHMLAVENDAMLRVIQVRRVLEKPGIARQGDRHDAVVLPCGKIVAACIARVLHAKHTFGIAYAGSIFQLGNFLGVLFRLAKVDGDLQFAARAVGEVTDILRDGIHLDVVASPAHFVECRCGSLGITCRHVLGEGLPYLRGRRRDASHKPCGKKVAGGLHILNQAFFHGSVA